MTAQAIQQQLVTSQEDFNTKTGNTGIGWSGSTWTGQIEKLNLPFLRTSVKADVGGTIFYDFSNNGTDVTSTFPVNGFEFSTFHEYHAADLGGRFFRIRVVFDSLPTDVSIYTYYSAEAPVLNSPLSQPVASDQDATTVKSILHGEDDTNPGSYIQAKMASDGALKTSIVSSLITFAHDFYIRVNVSSTTDRWDYFVGGSGGTKVAEILITYDTTSKNEVLSAGVTIL